MKKIKHIACIIGIGISILVVGLVFNILSGTEYLINKINK